ncbi:hypothetical protein [Streptomyces sp. NPDC049585]|uniref:hypothetical protein n=1 Tax=Streptomyces sp. NPDC049585 TaxID=3155154 RepID=UPI003419B3E2
MTTTQGRSREGLPTTTANPAQGLRIERVPGRRLKLTEAGRFAMELRVLIDGSHVGDGVLVMPHDEATAFGAELHDLLCGRSAQSTSRRSSCDRHRRAALADAAVGLWPEGHVAAARQERGEGEGCASETEL